MAHLGIGVFAVHNNRNRAGKGASQGVRHNRVSAFHRRDNIESVRISWPNYEALHPYVNVLWVPALIYAVPNAGNWMERGKFIRTGVDKVNPDALTGLSLQPARCIGIMHRVVFKNATVEHDVRPFVLHHVVLIVGIRIQLGLNQDIFTIRFRHRVWIFRIDDNRSKHPSGDMLNHGVRAAVIIKYPWVIRGEYEVLRLTRLNGAKILDNVELSGVKVDRVRVLIITVVD